MNTFRIDVSCACLIEYDSIADLLELETETLPKPIMHIGRGSNLLFTDDFRGTVVHSCIDLMEILDRNVRIYADCSRDYGEVFGEDDVLVSAGAGTVFDELCAWTAGMGLWGLENLSLIPGEVGAAAVQNIGAYGVEVGDIVRYVYCYDLLEEEIVRFDKKILAYSYRDSVFKHEGFKGRYFVTHVVLKLSRSYRPQLDYGHVRKAVEETGKPVTPDLVRSVIIGIRKDKLPDPLEIGNAGSFFKNPVVSEEVFENIRKKYGADVPGFHLDDGRVKVPAAWLIEKCGWKGKKSGNVGVYDKQSLVIVNITGKAFPEEIISLERRITESVRKEFSIILEPEVEHIY